jgi:CYTH domain-containing protein
MALEIERKFLVRPELLPHLQSGLNILQGYLSDEPSIRFRIVGEKVIITIKRLNKDGSRFELETEKSGVSIDEQEDLKSLARYPVIEKIRYRIPYFDLIWEVDVYQGENLGLITVDVELPSLNYPIKFPEWVNPEAEITTDPRYFNWNLGQFPYSKWVN